jgi:hypothetical protein
LPPFARAGCLVYVHLTINAAVFLGASTRINSAAGFIKRLTDGGTNTVLALPIMLFSAVVATVGAVGAFAAPQAQPFGKIKNIVSFGDSYTGANP